MYTTIVHVQKNQKIKFLNGFNIILAMENTKNSPELRKTGSYL